MALNDPRVLRTMTQTPPAIAYTIVAVALIGYAAPS